MKDPAVLNADSECDLRQAQVRTGWGRAAVVMTVIGLGIRLGLSFVSVGTNDTYTWQKFGWMVGQFGLADAYHHDRLLNHPPIPTLWAYFCHLLEPRDPQGFAFWMRLPAILSDVAVCLLLWLTVNARFNAKRAFMAVCIFALSPAAILISAFHCNTDSVCVMLMLWALFLGDRKRWLATGVVLSLAINIKLIPVLIIPGCLACCSKRKLPILMTGLAIGVIPFLVLASASGTQAIKNIVGYDSSYENWGVVALLRACAITGLAPEAFFQAAWNYHDLYGKWLMLAMIAITPFWRVRRAGLLETGSQAAAWFVGLAPGFGIQYLIYASTPMLAVSPRWGLYVTAACGAFAASVYFVFLDSTSPARSYFITIYPNATAVFGGLAWATILTYAATCFVTNLFARSGDGTTVSSHD